MKYREIGVQHLDDNTQLPEDPLLPGSRVSTFRNGDYRTSVLEATRIEQSALNALIRGACVAVRIPGYASGPECENVTKALLSSPRFGPYRNAEGIERVGMAFFEATSETLRDHYFEHAISSIQDLRRALAPNQSPMDRIRLELEEAWPAGAQLERIFGRSMFVGLARVFKDGSEALPHIDRLSYDVPSSDRARQLRTQLAVNVYLTAPQQGGELELWSQQPSREEYESLRMPNSYGLDRRSLGRAAATIMPRVGDLIIFDATRIHAVRPTEGAPRITLSAFIGYSGPETPLTYWS